MRNRRWAVRSSDILRSVDVALVPGGGLLVADRRSHRLRYLSGAYSPPLRFTIHGGGDLPGLIRRVFLTLAVLWDGRSERLAAPVVRGIRRDATLHLLPFERLLQWVQGALWAEAVTPVFEDLSQVGAAE